VGFHAEGQGEVVARRPIRPEQTADSEPRRGGKQPDEGGRPHQGRQVNGDVEQAEADGHPKGGGGDGTGAAEDDVPAPAAAQVGEAVAQVGRASGGGEQQGHGQILA
jgi:hypothetical protein